MRVTTAKMLGTRAQETSFIEVSERRLSFLTPRGKPVPFDSEPESAYRICMQKNCTQLYQAKLWKCPALAYHAQLEAKLKLHHLPQWQPFRDYQACPPDASDDEVRRFLQTKAIPQCGLCPSHRTKFVHPNPLQRSALR